MNLNDDTRSKLDAIRRLVGEERDELFVKIMKNSATGDRLPTVLQFMIDASFVNEVVKTIVIELADPAFDAGNATDGQIKGLAYMIQGFVEADRRRELAAKIPIEARANVYFDATRRIHDEVNQKEAIQRESRMDRSKLLAHLASKCAVSQDAIDAALRELAELAVRETNAHMAFEVPGIGTIFKNFRKERQGRNPQNGEPIFIPAKTVVRFRLDSKVRMMCGDEEARTESPS